MDDANVSLGRCSMILARTDTDNDNGDDDVNNYDDVIDGGARMPLHTLRQHTRERGVNANWHRVNGISVRVGRANAASRRSSPAGYVKCTVNVI